MNSDFVVEQAKLIAKEARAFSDDPGKQVGRCFQLILKRLPDWEERKFGLEVASEAGLELVCRSLINSNEFAFLP